LGYATRRVEHKVEAALVCNKVPNGTTLNPPAEWPSKQSAGTKKQRADECCQSAAYCVLSNLNFVHPRRSPSGLTPELSRAAKRHRLERIVRAAVKSAQASRPAG